MVGDKRVIDALNKNLADEHGAIVQYITHSRICAGWGFEGLASYFEKRAVEEMKHSQMLIDRIMFLEGIPSFSDITGVSIGKAVEEMLEKDHDSEEKAIAGYNDAIKLCVELKDNGTRALLESILSEEEAHIDAIESHQSQIEMMGIKTYLAENIKD